MNKWRFDLYKYESVLGDYWKFVFSCDNEVITDVIECEDLLTGEEVNEQQAIECAFRIFTAKTGLIYISKGEMVKVL